MDLMRRGSLEMAKLAARDAGGPRRGAGAREAGGHAAGAPRSATKSLAIFSDP